MIRLYSGSGSQEVQVLEQPLPHVVWTATRKQTVKLLQARGAQRAATLLDTIPFELREGTNSFNDDFSLLYYRAPLEQYVKLADAVENEDDSYAYRQIAEVVSEIDRYIRFIVVDLASEVAPATVAKPTLEIQSDSVERALADAQHLIHIRGAASGVDRVHTAFHGYLKAAATRAAIAFPEDASITMLFKLLREKHPALAVPEPRAGDIDRIIQSMAIILDALNPLRNRASGAHPNEMILQEAEAMLVINGVMTMLHYLDAKFRKGGAT